MVMVSAYTREEMVKEAESLGIANVLVKPLSPSMLFDTTMQALGAHRAEDRTSRAQLPDNNGQLATLRGARILVAEDNDINQQIARELLEDAGFVVDVATDGQIAVEMAQKMPYSLVLMDMQMPVMDGLQATLALRLVPGLENLAIVAMTANARDEDRRSCLAAGMNDFLSKPIDPDMLWSILLKWVKPPASKSSSTSPLPPLPPNSNVSALPQSRPVPGARDDLPQGIDGLDIAKGLSHMMGKKSLYITMLRKFVVGQQTCIQSIRDALDAQDVSSAQRIAHTLKGVAATLGATAVAGLASHLEAALKEQRPSADVKHALAALQPPLEQLICELQIWLPD
jgi:two-component system sensor histidine kinase/response regulator